MALQYHALVWYLVFCGDLKGQLLLEFISQNRDAT